MHPVLTLADRPDPALAEAIYANFREHAAASQVPSDIRPLTIRAERDGVLLGGLVGRTGRQWLFIDNVALPMREHGSGLGTQLVRLAEQEARARSCVGAFLQTLRFQAPGFYEKLGYTEFARLPHGADERLDRIWFSRRFAE